MPGHRTILVGSLTGMLLAGGAVFAHQKLRIFNETGVIRACVDNTTGVIRIVRPNDDCSKRESMIEWNQIGPQGLMGPMGPAGAAGAAGPQGPQGSQGAPGAQGSMGPAGSTGPAGPEGQTGAAGPEGPAGQQGEAGAAGAAGNEGAAGAAGPIGPQGPQGPVGAQGPQGLQGQMGLQGPQGQQGQQGTTGATGATGPQGPTGGIRVFDGQNQELGAFSFPNFLTLKVGNEVVTMPLNLDTRGFLDQRPVLYYNAGWCVGTPLMKADLTRMGAVSGNILFYPTGAATSQQYNAMHNGSTCVMQTGTMTLAPIGQATVSAVTLPLSLVK